MGESSSSPHRRRPAHFTNVGNHYTILVKLPSWRFFNREGNVFHAPHLHMRMGSTLLLTNNEHEDEHEDKHKDEHGHI